MVSSIDERFLATHRKSRELWQRSLKVSRGVHHDSRHAQPFPIYCTHAQGARKWDVDGNEYIDYTMGHGSLMFGHAHPVLVEAVSRQVALGTHFGAETLQALEWAELVHQLVPCAERVEFVMTGTEANMLAAQLSRACTGRHKVLKFSEHFFGWYDELQVGVNRPYDKPVAGRLPSMYEDAVSGGTVVIPVNDLAALEKALAKRDIAALFLEGGGAHCGEIGLPPDVVRMARELTSKYGSLLVIDEVITGFRWSPGGYQATVGVVPDLSSLGKMVSGGLPGAALCGRADVMEYLEVKPGQAGWNRYRRVVHPGTWNGNPLAAAAGTAMLKLLVSTEPQKQAEMMAHRLAKGINAKMAEAGIEGCAFNASSAIHVFIGKCQGCDRSVCLDSQKQEAPGVPLTLQKYLLMNGVHLLRGTVGWVSAVHTVEDIDLTVEAFGRALYGMAQEGAI